MPDVRRVLFCSATVLALGASGIACPSADASAVRYANCTALRKHYPHGVGRKGARDHVSGHSKPVTTFTRNTAVYNANTGSDRDHDGIACEQA